jgi:hypothetical protein
MMVQCEGELERDKKKGIRKESTDQGCRWRQ